MESDTDQRFEQLEKRLEDKVSEFTQQVTDLHKKVESLQGETRTKINSHCDQSDRGYDQLGKQMKQDCAERHETQFEALKKKFDWWSKRSMRLLEDRFYHLENLCDEIEERGIDLNTMVTDHELRIDDLEDRGTDPGSPDYVPVLDKGTEQSGRGIAPNFDQVARYYYRQGYRHGLDDGESIAHGAQAHGPRMTMKDER